MVNHLLSWWMMKTIAVCVLTFTMLMVALVTKTHDTIFSQCIGILMIQRDLSDTGNIFKKLKHGYIINSWWNID